MELVFQSIRAAVPHLGQDPEELVREITAGVPLGFLGVAEGHQKVGMFLFDPF